MTMPRMRTAERLMDIIKEQDPDTEITLYYLRRLIRAEAVPVVNCGRKKLVNADAVLELLASGYEIPKTEPTYNQVRKVI